jgi:uncharacterized protein DUF6174
MNSALRFRLFCVLLLIASPVLIAPSCSNFTTTPELETAAFKKNQQLWKSKNITNYQYTLKERCYCPLQYLGPNKIEVRNGKTESITYIGESKNIDMKGVKLPDTIEKLFEIASGLDDDAVVYDSTYGFPTSISMYGPKGTQDTSSFYFVRDFEVIK